MNNSFDNWQATKKIKQQYPDFTKNAPYYEAGKEEDLKERLEKRLARTITTSGNS